MKTEEILIELNECIQNADFSGLDENLDLLLEKASDEGACRELAQLIGSNYTQYKSDGLAIVLQTIIRKRPNLALINHPFNFLFQMTVSTGSLEMYECFIEEAVMPYLADIPTDEHEMHFIELLNTAQELTGKLFLENRKCIKGLHYNGAFSPNGNAVLVNEQDYIIMEDVVERYNAIVGRGEIINDLNTRGGVDLQ